MVQFPQCMDCKNYIGKNENEKLCCRAFPDGIPDDIFWNKIDHKENINGDRGIKFEKISEI